MKFSSKKSLAAMAFLAFLVSIAFGFSSCGPSRLEAQEMAVDSDILFEYHLVTNDSIALLVGNMLRLHTGKTKQFYPLLVSERNPTDLDMPTATDVIESDSALVAYLRAKRGDITRLGLVIGESCAQDPNFSESIAIQNFTRLASKFPGSSATLFRTKGDEISSAKSLR